MQIEHEVRIKTSPQKIYALLSKTTNIAKLIPNIKVKVVEKDEDSQVANWQLTTEKETFNWKQRENFDPQMLRIDYSLIEGGWQSYIARWQINPVGRNPEDTKEVNPTGEECDLILQIDITPLQKGLKKYVYWPFFRKKLQQFCKEAIQAVKDRSELSYGQST